MVVPYASPYPSINQLAMATGLCLTSTPDPSAAASSAPAHLTPQQRFLQLLHEAERLHQQTTQRALRAESQVQQLRQLFQQWQQQLQQQMDAQRQGYMRQQQQLLAQQQQLVGHEMQQLRVQRQMQSLHDGLRQQQTTCRSQYLQVHERMDEMYSFQQLQAFAHQQQLGQLQVQLFNLERDQRAERRNRQILQRQVGPSRRATPRHQPPSAPTAAGGEPEFCCLGDDCCPCEYPAECPYNPCFPVEECCPAEVPEGPEGDSCFLRDIRLGFVQPLSCAECKIQSKIPKRKKKLVPFYEESESGYTADDEASEASTVTSENSSSFKEERRRLLQEVRSLKNTHLTPRYQQIWEPLRCFHCGKPDHLAKFCPHQPTTIL